jgi:hypothetical protein
MTDTSCRVSRESDAKNGTPCASLPGSPRAVMAPAGGTPAWAHSRSSRPTVPVRICISRPAPFDFEIVEGLLLKVEGRKPCGITPSTINSQPSTLLGVKELIGRLAARPPGCRDCAQFQPCAAPSPLNLFGVHASACIRCRETRDMLKHGHRTDSSSLAQSPNCIEDGAARRPYRPHVIFNFAF